MLARVLRYLGMDEETKRQRAEMSRNLEHVDSKLDLLQVKLDEFSKVRAVERDELHQTLTESNFGGKRKRSPRVQG